MPDDNGTETTRSDAPGADENLFGERGTEWSRGGRSRRDQSSEGLKVVVSIKGGRATIGVQRPRPTRTSSPSMPLTWPG